MKRLIFVFVFCLTLINNLYAQKAQEKISINSVVEGIQKFYDTAFAIDAIFIQEATIKSVNKVQTSRGKVYFKKPGKMAWIYEEPTRQKIITDGLTLWMYFPENNQVIKNRTNQAFMSETPQNFLSGLGNIKKDFIVNFVPPVFDTEKNVLLEFIPRTQQQAWTKIFATARPVVYNGQNLYHIIQTTIHDRFGNLNKISFYNINAYSKDQAFSIPDSIFEFIPPAGVRIIEPPAQLRAQ